MIIQKTLDNGIKIVMEKIPSVQSVSIGIWNRVGSVDENDSNSGISHLIEHMLFKGTKKRNAKQIAEDVDRIGGHINAFTGKEFTCYYIKTLDNNASAGCDIILDMFTESAFDPEELIKEKRVIYEEIKMIEDSPEEYVVDLLFESVFRGTPLESHIIGTYESLASISRDTLIDYMKQKYTADNIVISIAGSFNEDELYNIFNSRLAGIKKGSKEQALCIADYSPEYKLKIKDVEQSHLCLGIKSVPLEDDLYFAMTLFNSVTGGSMSSRLFQNIREQKGLAYSVYSSYHPYSHDGVFHIYAGVSHDKIKSAIEGIAEEIHNLSKKGIIQDELQIAKEQLKSSYVFGQENVNNRMYANGKNQLLLGRLVTPNEIINKIDKVDMKDLHRISDLMTDWKKYSVVLISNKECDLKQFMGK